jgi:uncharacterized protein involved in outer membrane biogenesis
MTPGLQIFKKSKWARRAAGFAAVLLLVWMLGWVAVPPIVKYQLETLASEALGRQVRVGEVDFLPWSLELTIRDVEVARADGTSVQARIKRLYIDGELESLLRMAPVVGAVVVEGPWVALAHHGDGAYDMDDVLARLRPAQDKPKGNPLKFALYNLVLSGGSVDFTDRPRERTHELRNLQVSVPFLSNLPSHREIKVQPRLAFLLNGSRFDTAAEGTPFAQTGKTDATLRIAALDLAPYLRYVPSGMPVQLQAAVVDADLRLAFEQSPQVALKLSGAVEVKSAKAADARDQPMFGFDALSVTLADVRPLERQIHLSSLELTKPWLEARRDKSGRPNLDFAGASAQAAPVDAKRAEGTAAWRVDLDQLVLRDGSVVWTDNSTTSPARLTLADVALEASALGYPAVQPARFQGSASLFGPSPSAHPSRGTNRSVGQAQRDMSPAATLRFSGEATQRAVTATASVNGLGLELAAPYLAQVVRPALAGNLSAELQVRWQASAEGPQPNQPVKSVPASHLTLEVPQLRLDKVALREGAQTLAGATQLQVTGARIDLTKQTVSIGKVALKQPLARLERAVDKRWNFLDWWMPATAGAASQQAEVAAGTAPKWALAIQDLAVEDGALFLRDAATPRPVEVAMSAVKLQMKDVAPDTARASPLALSARIGIGGGQAEPGSLAYQGSMNFGAMAAQGEVQARRIPLHAFEPYFADRVNIELLRADASFTGRVQLAQIPGNSDAISVRATGNGAIEDFRANGLPGSSAGGAVLGESAELLSWKALSLRGMDVAMSPRNPTSVEVQETVLSDFFARLIVHENGRINLQDLLKPPVVAQAAAAPSMPANPSHTAGTVGTLDKVGAASTESDAVIRFGPVSLLNGKVHFSDRLVKPSYSADLSELTGKLSAFSSIPSQGTAQLADLDLRGRAEGTASLEIVGKFNPLAKPLALDIRGKVRDLELPALSPYAIKYAGHGIERGKLSLDVAYRVQPDGQLTASNKLVLHQLVFGEKVDGAPNSWPVKLAVALLADRNGVIDLDLPVSGSLNDPQFSLAPVIFKLIFNLVAKAITSPFSLLAGAMAGGGDDLGTVAFAPGSAVLAQPARESLDKVAKALADRPALKMTVIGTASLDAERDAMRRERLRALVLAEKRRAMVLSGAGQAASSVGAVGDEEYPALLKDVYKRAEIPKPRNLIGMARDLPPTEMEGLLLVQIPANDEVIRELAVQRGVAVRDYLAGRGIIAERLFLGAAKALPADPKWSPHAELNLAMP